MGRYPLPGEKTDEVSRDPWWKAGTWAAHDEVTAAARRALAEPTETNRRLRLQRYLAFYGGAERYAVVADRHGAIVDPERERVALNVCRSVVDTATSMFSRVRTKVVFQTVDGDWTLHRKAKALETFARGHIEESGLYQVQPMVARDAMVCDAGLVETVLERGKVRAKKVPPWEVFTPSVQMRMAAPHEWFRVEVRDKAELEAWALDEEWVAGGLRHKTAMKEAIRNARAPSDEDFFAPSLVGSGERDRSQCVVWHAWRCASYDGAEDGRYVVCVDGATLRDEVYDREGAPFLSYTWSPPEVGWVGTGIIEMIYGIQQEMNYTARAIRDAHHLVGKGRWFVPRTARVDPNHLADNRVARQVTYDGGVPPTYVNTLPVSEKLYEELDKLARRAYEQSGVNQMSATAEKQPGVTAGIAIKRVQDLQSRRLAEPQERYERFTIDVVKDGMRVLRKALSDFPEQMKGYRVLGAAARGRVFIDVRKVVAESDEESFVLLPGAQNALSDDPAGKIDDVMALVDLGVVKDEQALLDLLDIPDTEGYAQIQTAPLRYARFLVEKLYDGKKAVVDKKAPLAYVERILVAAFLNALTFENVPQAIVTNMNDCIDDVRRKIAEVAPQPPPPAPMMNPAGANGMPATA